MNTLDLTVLNLEPDTSLFTSTCHQSVDVNPKSDTVLDEKVTPALLSTASGQMLNLKMAAGASPTLQSYPVFNMTNKQVKDDSGADILLTANYKVYEDILR